MFILTNASTTSAHEPCRQIRKEGEEEKCAAAYVGVSRALIATFAKPEDMPARRRFHAARVMERANIRRKCNHHHSWGGGMRAPWPFASTAQCVQRLREVQPEV